MGNFIVFEKRFAINRTSNRYLNDNGYDSLEHYIEMYDDKFRFHHEGIDLDKFISSQYLSPFFEDDNHTLKDFRLDYDASFEEIIVQISKLNEILIERTKLIMKERGIN